MKRRVVIINEEDTPPTAHEFTLDDPNQEISLGAVGVMHSTGKPFPVYRADWDAVCPIEYRKPLREYAV